MPFRNRVNVKWDSQEDLISSYVIKYTPMNMGKHVTTHDQRISAREYVAKVL